MTDELVERFLRVIRDLGKDNKKGWASGEAIMQRMGWDPSDLYLGNPTNDKAREDAKRYKELARHCEDMGYITKESDMYGDVAITPEGERYIGGG